VRARSLRSALPPAQRRTVKACPQPLPSRARARWRARRGRRAQVWACVARRVPRHQDPCAPSTPSRQNSWRPLGLSGGKQRTSRARPPSARRASAARPCRDVLHHRLEHCDAIDGKT
jgi:hypothetical protein